MKKNKINKISKPIIVILVMAVLLVGAFGYVGIDLYSEARVARDLKFQEAGASYGYELAISEISRLAGSCQQVPLTYKNETIVIVDLSCLNIPQQN